MREQRLVFGEIAELYDRARAGYPGRLVDDVLTFAGSKCDSPALEIGAGTGKATVAFAARGLDVLALEPHPAMAAVARRNCERFPGVRVEVTTFEDWPLEPKRFGLAFSGQAWHWVAAEVRGAKAADALVPGGTLALFWHRTNWQGEDLRAELEDLYRRVAPDLYAQEPGFPGLHAPRDDGRFVSELTGSGRFHDVRAQTYPWSSTFTSETFVDLLLTQSNHRLLVEDRRNALMEAVGDLVAGHGNVVTVPHATLLVLARAAG